MTRWFYKLLLRFRSLFRKSTVEQELSDELRFHMEKLIEEKVARGMAKEAARYAALRELGGLESGWGQYEFDIGQGGVVQHANGLYTSGSYFGTLGVRPATGRLFTTADDQRGCPSVAVLSYGFWQDQFGGERSAVGKVLSLNHHPFQIIGVSAPGFYGM